MPETPFALRNDSVFVGRRGDTDWWEWTAYIAASEPDSLDHIKYVEYYLHSSFRNPVKRVRKKEGGFRLESKGWGTFELRAKVVFKDKVRSPVLLSHLLEFEGAA